MIAVVARFSSSGWLGSLFYELKNADDNGALRRCSF
jgi:hypothetical protein